jgi:hypothetical protein
MPGFNIGGGRDGNEPSNVAETRRKHRWLFEVVGPIQREALLFLQKASRPNFKYEEAIMHHDQEQAYFAGKQSWEPITLSWYDAEQNPDVSKQLHNWIVTVTTGGLGAGGGAVTVAVPSAYKKEAKLSMTNGAGAPTETWTLKGVWPQQTNWGDLDYTNTEIQLVEVTMRFDRAIKDL